MGEPADEAVPAVPLSVALPVVALGGAAGGMGRYAVAAGVGTTTGTLVVNLVGCLLLGLLVGVRPRSPLARLGLGTGVLGGFTTMSTFALDTVQRTVLPAAALVAVSVGGGLLLSRVGLSLARGRGPGGSAPRPGGRLG